MYKLILPLLIAASTAVPASSMHVVVVTRDRIVVDYRCENFRSAMEESPVMRSVVRSGGHISWHGVGGVAPYTLIDKSTDAFGNVCITLMDATGMMATGCGIMQERRMSVGIECPLLEEEPIITDPINDTTLLRKPASRWNGKLPEPSPEPREPKNVRTAREIKHGPTPRDPERRTERRERDVNVERPVVVRERAVHNRNDRDRSPSVNERSRTYGTNNSVTRSRSNSTSGGGNGPTRYVPSGSIAR